MTDTDSTFGSELMISNVSTEIAGFYGDYIYPYFKMTLWGLQFELYDHRSYTFMIIASFALTILVVGIYGKYNSIRGLEVNQNSLLLKIKDVGMPNYPIYDETIFYNGVVTVAGSPIDNIFGIATTNQPVLVRSVKVLCWKEKTYNSMSCMDTEENGTDDIIEQKQCYEYEKKWVDTKNYIDSSTFNNKDYNLNIKPAMHESSCFFKCQRLSVGPYQVDVKSLEKALSNRFKQCPDENKLSTYVQLKNIFESGFEDDYVDPRGTWRYNGKKHYLHRRKVDGKDTVGDLQVTWLVLNAGFEDEKEVQMSACGYAQGGQLKKIPELDCMLSMDYTSKRQFIKENYKGKEK